MSRIERLRIARDLWDGGFQSVEWWGSRCEKVQRWWQPKWRGSMGDRRLRGSRDQGGGRSRCGERLGWHTGLTLSASFGF